MFKTKATIIFYFKPQQRNIGIYYTSLTPTYCKDMPFSVAEIIKTTAQKIFASNTCNIENDLYVGNEYLIFNNHLTIDINPKI
jgi:hypothetical protein